MTGLWAIRNQDPYDHHDVRAHPDYAAMKVRPWNTLKQWRVDTKDPLLDGPIPDELNPLGQTPRQSKKCVRPV